MRFFTKFGPSNSPVYGFYQGFLLTAERRALVEAHSDIGSEAILNSGCRAGIKAEFSAIDVAGEFDSVVIDFG
jgi:hypothetical protein